MGVVVEEVVEEGSGWGEGVSLGGMRWDGIEGGEMGITGR